MNTIQRRTAAAAMTIPLIASAIVATAPTAHAAVRVGAIAYAPSGQYGGSKNYPSKAEAEAAAIKKCGLSSCEVLVTFSTCGAVAETDTQRAGGYGDTLEAAQKSALSRLPGSHIGFWVCNGT